MRIIGFVGDRAEGFSSMGATLPRGRKTVFPGSESETA